MRVVAAMTAVGRRREDDMWISLVLCLRPPWTRTRDFGNG